MAESECVALPFHDSLAAAGQRLSGLSQTKFVSAFSLLRESWDYAQHTSGDRWEFAVEFENLRAVGLSLNDLRWLVRMHYVEHAREVTQPDENGRRFSRSGDLTFCAATCFVLTESGIARAQALGYRGPADTQVIFCTAAGQQLTPYWNAQVRELRVGTTLVKRFKWQACNQEMILATFQEDGWPRVIDDPLPPQPQQDPKRRLHDTIKSLNRHQFKEMLRFHGDGTGEGVRWELLTEHH